MGGKDTDTLSSSVARPVNFFGLLVHFVATVACCSHLFFLSSLVLTRVDIIDAAFEIRLWTYGPFTCSFRCAILRILEIPIFHSQTAVDFLERKLQ